MVNEILIVAMLFGGAYILWMLPRVILLEIHHRMMNTKPTPSGKEYMEQMKERKDREES